LFQIINEAEPNDSPETSQSVDPLPVRITGEITQDEATVDTDYFSFDTQAGIEYQAVLSVGGMKLQLRALDSNQALLGTSSSSDSSIQFSWQSTGGINYIQVRKNDVPSATLNTEYLLEINQIVPTPTPPPTITPTPAPPSWDRYEDEPNDSFEQANLLTAPGSVTGGIINSRGNADYFIMHTGVEDGFKASLTVNSPEGLSLRMRLYSGEQERIRTSSPSADSSNILWIATRPYYYIRVEAITASPTLQSAIYDLDITEFTAYSLYLPLVLCSSSAP
jgi:hypothetical protein